MDTLQYVYCAKNIQTVNNADIISDVVENKYEQTLKSKQKQFKFLFEHMLTHLK